MEPEPQKLNTPITDQELEKVAGGKQNVTIRLTCKICGKACGSTKSSYAQHMLEVHGITVD
jgi:hypothetical protein